MASLKILLPLFLFLFLLSTAADPPPPTLPTVVPSLIDAAETLANSGYIAMSFTLQLIAPILPLPATAITPLTIFSPPDAAFVSSGQPSLAHLLLHFSPVTLSPAALLSFPFSTPIPSLSPSKHLIVTSNRANRISINNFGVSRVPLLDDGFVVVYAVDNLFDLNFTVLTNYGGINPRSDFQCAKLATVSGFMEPARVLKSRGRSIMGSFLELQLLGFIDGHGGEWIVFAPSDHELVKFSGDFLQYYSLFTRHLTACRLGWSDMEENQNASAEMKNMKGFPLIISKGKDNEMLMVNGVEITFPDMYVCEWLVIHGVGGVIPLPELLEEEESAQES